MQRCIAWCSVVILAWVHVLLNASNEGTSLPQQLASTKARSTPSSPIPTLCPLQVGAAFGRVMFAATEEDTAAASAALDDALQWLEGALHPTGPFALGDSFTLADCAIAPFLIRLQLIEALNGYKVPAGLSRVAAYQDAILARPSVQGSMAAAPDSSRPYLDQLVDTYKVYVEDRKKAAAASKP